MKITGGKRWFVVALCALMAGIMVYVPFLRYSFYDQMCVLLRNTSMWFHRIQ